MTAPLLQFEVRPLDAAGASEETWQSLTRLLNLHRAITQPDEEPRTWESVKRDESHENPLFQAVRWVAWSGGEIIGAATAVMPSTEENRHGAEVRLLVHPDLRRHGVGTALLREVVAAAQRDERRVLLAGVSDRVPDGAAFAEAIGAKAAMEATEHVLQLADVDRDLIRQWQERARERADGYELVRWVGPYPESEIDAVAALFEATNDIPRGEIEMDDWHFTPEMLRNLEKTLEARKVERWTIAARHTESGEYAGFTEVMWFPEGHRVLHQGLTAVHDRHRNRGLGRWIKGAMIDWILTERPDAETIKTGMATTNRPMRAINEELGFRAASSMQVWQGYTEDLARYLAACEQTGPHLVA